MSISLVPTARSIKHTIDQIIEQLNDLIDAAHPPTQRIFERENSDELNVQGTLTGDEVVQRFSIFRVAGWFEALGSDLVIRLFDDTADFDRILTGQNMNQEMPSILEYLRDEDIGSISVDVTITKAGIRAAIADRLGVSLTGLFFYSKAFAAKCDLLGISALWDAGLIAPEQHSVIAVLDNPGLLCGRYLTVLGLSTDTTADELTHRLEGSSLHNHQPSTAFRDTISIWSAPMRNALPEIFMVSSKIAGLEEVRNALEQSCAELSLLQFCSSVSKENNNLVATIANIGGPIITAAMRPEQSERGRLEHTAIQSAYGLYLWAFGEASYDKIDIVRDLSRRVFAGQRGISIELWIGQSPGLLQEARSAYQASRRDAIAAYFKARDETESRLVAFTANMRKSISGLTNDLLKRVLQVFASIIAYLAAAAVQPAFKDTAGIGAILLILYMFLVLVFQMVPTWQQHQHALGEVEAAIRRHEALSDEARGKMILELPKGMWTEFTIWYLICTAIYNVVIVMAVGFLLINM